MVCSGDEMQVEILFGFAGMLFYIPVFAQWTPRVSLFICIEPQARLFIRKTEKVLRDVPKQLR